MRKFEVSFSDGKFWLHMDGWEYCDSMNKEQLHEKLTLWSMCCKEEAEAKLWICRACAPGGRGCALIQATEPDRCITERDYSEEELKDLEDEGHRAPVDWTKGNINKLPPQIVNSLRARHLFGSEPHYYELGIMQAERALEEDEE